LGIFHKKQVELITLAKIKEEEEYDK